jgi:cytochrome c oxidase assembly protein subunit 15
MPSVALVPQRHWHALHPLLLLHPAAAAAQAASPSLALSRGLPDSARKALAWWLGGCSAWVFSMVVLGGFTRLTRSGLSMTDWKFTGETA